MKRGAAEKNVSGWIIFNKTIIYIKGILWEIYECASEVLSHFGEDVWCDFSAQWAQKVGGNSLCNIFSYCFHLQPVAVS